MNPEFLLGTRLAIHLATVVLLASYYRPEARFRWTPSLLAGALLASSASMAVQIVTTWNTLVVSAPQPQLVIFVFTVFLPIAWARGDMAKIYDALRMLGTGLWPWR